MISQDLASRMCLAATIAAEAAFPTMRWVIAQSQEKLGVRIYQGTDEREGLEDGQKVGIVLTTFSIEDQGFPPGSRGVGGTVRLGPVIMWMTRELAEKARAFAEKEEKP